LDGVRGNPTKALLGRSNAQPSIGGFDINFEFLPVSKRIGSVILTRWPATQMGGLFGDEDQIRFIDDSAAGGGARFGSGELDSQQRKIDDQEKK
jgi:hypothetical protein